MSFDQLIYLPTWHLVGIKTLVIPTRVSNRTGFLVPRDKGIEVSSLSRDNGTEFPSLSRDKGTSSKSCHGTGRDGPDGILTACPARNIQGQPRDRKEKRVKNYNQIVVLSRDFCCCFCPGTMGQRDKETFFVKGQRDSGKRKLFCSGTKGQRDVPSLRNPNTYLCTGCSFSEALIYFTM